MNTTKCQILLKAVELGSITRAAEALGYTQSAVSRAVADLEREWDVALLTRNRSGTVLTSQGEALLPICQPLHAGGNWRPKWPPSGLTRGTLRVGTFASASIQLLPAIMKEFMGLYPGIRFELLCCWEFAQVEDLIRRGQADCGFLGLPVGPDLETFPLFRDQLMAILPPDHPLSQAPFYPMARFAEDPFIRVPEDRDVEFGRIFQQAGVRPTSITPSTTILRSRPWWSRGWA